MSKRLLHLMLIMTALLTLSAAMAGCVAEDDDDGDDDTDINVDEDEDDTNDGFDDEPPRPYRFTSG